MIKIFIAEDSQENIDTLQVFLSRADLTCEVTGIGKTLDEAYELLKENNYDLAFLDIQFKKGTIFSILDRLNQEEVSLPDIVFITAHGSFEYAVKAIQYACLDFINKPINGERFFRLLEDVAGRKSSAEDQKKQINLLLELIEGDVTQPKTVGVIRPKNMIDYIALEDLLYVKADGSTSLFHTTKKTFTSVRHLGHYVDLFQDNNSIVQISRFSIVNRDHIDAYNPASRIITLSDGTQLQASHRANKNLRKSLKKKDSSSLINRLGQLKDILLRD